MQNLHQTSKQKQRKSRMEKGRKGLKSYWSVLTKKQKIFYSSFHFKVNKIDFILFCRPNRRYMESSDESEEPPPKRKSPRKNQAKRPEPSVLQPPMLLFLNKRNIHAHNCAQNAKCYKIFFLWIERCNRQPGTLHLHSLLCRVHVRLVWWKAHLLKQVVNNFTYTLTFYFVH